ncbi:MAG: helical backbone metal receptor, partial [Cryomorphaceae bacterium]|nr:helical backbone metal receptor [Cryomorphaceae bacterium]
LNPDFIIANKEENNREDIEQLMAICPVYVSDVETLNDNLSMIADLGEICGKKKSSAKLISDIKAAFATLPPPPKSRPRVLYFIWKNPWMVAGNDTFIHQMLNACGMDNVIEQGRYPEIDEDSIRSLNPDYVFLSSEPFPFKAKHLHELHELAPNAIIQLVNGEYFSWYGSMVKYSPAYFRRLMS